MQSIINATNISKRLGKRAILGDINLHVNSGEKVAIYGEPGSGKTTLFEILSGLEPFDDGSLSIDGTDIPPNSDIDKTARIRESSIGFLFKELHLIPFNTVYENIAVPLLLKSYSLEKSRPIIEKIMDDFGLLGLENTAPTSLSEVEKHRVALARATVHTPEIIFADNPTGELNTKDEEHFLELLDASVSDRQCALVLMTHSAKSASICESQYKLENCCLTVIKSKVK